MSKASRNAVCLFYRYACSPKESSPSLYRTLAQARFASTNPNFNASDGVSSDSSSLTLSHAELEQQLKLDNAADILRRTFLGPRSTQRARQITQRLFKETFGPQKRNNAGPAYYRLQEVIAAEDPKVGLTMDLLRFQLRSCLKPEDITRVLTKAFEFRSGPALLANSSLQRIIRKQLECSEPHRALMCLSLFVSRLQMRKQTVEIETLWDALLTAARCHNTTAVRRFIRLWHNRVEALGGTMEIDSYKELLQALNSGNKSENRQSSSADRRAMLEILYGGSDTAYSWKEGLRQYLNSYHAESLQLWIEMLVDLGAGSHVWREWEMITLGVQPLRDSLEGEYAASKGPGLFMRALFRVHQPDRAWQIFTQYNNTISEDDRDIWESLFEHAHLKPELDEAAQRRLEKKFLGMLEEELLEVERGLAIEWGFSTDGGSGQHVACQRNDMWGGEPPRTHPSLYYHALVPPAWSDLSPLVEDEIPDYSSRRTTKPFRREQSDSE